MGNGKKNIFSSMDHIPKMLRFEVRQLFQIPLTAAGGSLASSLRFASLRSQTIAKSTMINQ